MNATAEIMAGLRARYAPPAYAFFEQVHNRTGGADRSADAMALSLWQSRGLELEGFEVKASRNDWLRELRNPGKADTLCAYCDRWWIAVPNTAIVAEGELPPTWGLIIVNGAARVATKAPKLEPVPLTRPFVAALLRRANEMNPREEYIREEVARRTKAATAALDKRIADAKAAEAYPREAAERKIREFEAASGVKIDSWNAGNIGAAVRQVLDGDAAKARRDWEHIRERVRSLHELMERERPGGTG